MDKRGFALNQNYPKFVVMILKAENKEITGFNQVSVSLRLDSLASTFGFVFFFDPQNTDHKKIFKPGAYPKITIEHEGQLLLTGTILSVSFGSGPQKQLATISGYSLPGVLEDCNIPVALYPLQNDGLSLKQITERLIKNFGLALQIADLVKNAANIPFEVTTADEKQSIKSYIATLASQKHIILSHTPDGKLLFTRITTRTPIVFTYTPGKGVFTALALAFNGQAMHNTITVQKQADEEGGNEGISTINNPYVPTYRPRVVNQTSGDDNSTNAAARNILGEELTNITLNINTDRWDVDGKVWQPGQLISVQDDELYLYTPTTFILREVTLTADETSQTATLVAVLPEVYNNDAAKNIFG